MDSLEQGEMQDPSSLPPPLPPPPAPPPLDDQARERPDGIAPELQTSVLDDVDLLNVERAVESEAREEAARIEHLSNSVARDDVARDEVAPDEVARDEVGNLVREEVLSDFGLVSSDDADVRSRGASVDKEAEATAAPAESEYMPELAFSPRTSMTEVLGRKSWVATVVDPSTLPPGKEESPAAKGLLRVTNDDLQEAALRGDLSLTRRLIHAGCSVNAPMRPESDDEFMTLLHVVASKPELPNGTRIISEIVRAEADLNARTSYGATPLICACKGKFIGAAEVLLSNKAQMDPIDDDGRNAICCAVLEDEDPDSDMLSLEIVDLLAKAGAELNDGGDFKPITEAVKQHKGEMVDLLIKLGAEGDGLHEAVQSCPLSIIKALTEAEANPFKRNHEGKVVMDIALQRGDEEIKNLMRDYIGDLQRQQHRHLKTLMEYDTDEEGDEDYDGVGRQASCHRGASLGVRKSLLEIMQPRHLYIPESRLGRETKKCMSLARRVNKNKYFQGVMFSTLLVALFAPDMWVIFDIVEERPLDVILICIISLFVLEFLLQVVGLWKSYVGSFFFCMDLVGIFSVPLDLSWVLNVMPMISSNTGGAHDGVVMRAARMVKLGVRAGRFTKLVKLLRFMPGINQNAGGAGTAKVITSTLNRALSTQVSICIILMVIVLPLFDLLRYPTNDFSLSTWIDTLAYTAWRFPQDMQETLEDLEEHFADQDYYPYQVKYTYENGSTEVSELTRMHPARVQNKILLRSKDSKTEMLVNFEAPNRVDSVCNIVLVLFVIVVMMGSALLLSNAVSGIVMMPLENLLNGVQKMASTIFKSVATMAAGGDDDTSKDSEGADKEGNETLLLEKVLKKLSTLSEITVKKSPIDADTLEQMGESDRAVLQGYSTGPPPGMDMDVGPVVSEFQDEDADERLMTRIEDYMRDVGFNWDDADSWDFNPMDLNDKQRHAVTTCILLFYRGRGGGSNEHDEWMHFSNFVDGVSKCYNPSRQVPYHNWYHAVDVGLTMYRVLRIAATEHYFSAHERFALMVSAVCHDIGHPGVNNPFLIETSHEMAVRYNDHSPLENMHCSKLFELSRQPNMAIFEGLHTSTYRDVRHVCIDAILHTDYQHHFTMVKEIQMFYEMNNDLFDQADEVYKASGNMEFPCKEATDFLRSSDVKKQTRSVLLHFCDVSNPMKTWNQCKMWANMITEEFFSQGDKELQLDLQVQPLNDRTKVNKPYSQVGFIEFFVAPLALALAKLIPTLQFCTVQLFENLDCWVKEWAENSDPKPDADEHAKVLERITKLVGKATPTREGGMTSISVSTKHKSIAIPAMGFRPRHSKGNNP